ncbi:DUF192 domain-containing protein [Sporolituus thermophilus]|uniref:DUF192 domain-containing protein n=1 Tax=Sporolituus thermophilus DSM 23256 TaxID=1123285 RepID=A0A1G7HN18_9FIRM|nr:DUF192 domain-containing protein [Sporolituus thermophilus]SDF01842.1 hypothetical protein SAMN05660235_00160 [Sporolituus thermophilus DSM 23256]
MLKNVTRGTVVATRVRVADTFWRRLKGLLGTTALPIDAALILRPCNSVHTIGMRYAIDVLFLDKTYRVVKIVGRLGPNRLAAAAGAVMAVELPAGTAAKTNTAVGDYLELY